MKDENQHRLVCKHCPWNCNDRVLFDALVDDRLAHQRELSHFVHWRSPVRQGSLQYQNFSANDFLFSNNFTKRPTFAERLKIEPQKVFISCNVCKNSEEEKKSAIVNYLGVIRIIINLSYIKNSKNTSFACLELNLIYSNILYTVEIICMHVLYRLYYPLS